MLWRGARFLRACLILLSQHSLEIRRVPNAPWLESVACFSENGDKDTYSS